MPTPKKKATKRRAPARAVEQSAEVADAMARFSSVLNAALADFRAFVARTDARAERAVLALERIARGGT